MQININEISYTHSFWIFLFPMILAGADVLTGWIQASINNTWDSTVMRKGLYRKGGEILVVLLAFISECAVAVMADVHLATCMSIYVVIMEAVSVIENLSAAGVTVPQFLRTKLNKIKDEAERDE